MNVTKLLPLTGVLAALASFCLGMENPLGESIAGSDYETVALKTASGTGSVAAFFGGTGDRVVVFVPGAVFGKESWFFLAKRFQQNDIASLALDGKAKDDVLSAIEWLKGKGFKEIALVGGSRGGAAILDALQAPADACISKAVLLAPAGGKPIASSHIDKLFIVAEGDALGLYDAVHDLYEASSEPKSLVVRF